MLHLATSSARLAQVLGRGAAACQPVVCLITYQVPFPPFSLDGISELLKQTVRALGILQSLLASECLLTQHSSHANALAMRPLSLAICGPRTVFKSETKGLSRVGREVQGEPLPPFFFLTHAICCECCLVCWDPRTPVWRSICAGARATARASLVC